MEKETEAHVKQDLQTYAILFSLSYLKFIFVYAENIVAYSGNDLFAKTYAENLLSEKQMILNDAGQYVWAPSINVTPEIRDKVKTHIGNMYPGLHSPLIRNAKVFIEVFEGKIRERQLGQKRAFNQRKLTYRFKEKWKTLPITWKILTGLVITSCAAGIVVSGVLLPPSLLVTLPIAGSAPLLALVMAAISAVTVATISGHLTHIAYTKIGAGETKMHQL